MLVDNDRNQHEQFREILRRIDPAHTCVKAFSTESAMEALLEPDDVLPDIIFLELEFKAGSGTQMLKALKKTAALQEIPVCIYTGSLLESDRKTTDEMGAIGYIVKDPNMTNVKTSIQAVIAAS